MEQHHKKCLLLNADYTPLNIIDWQRALIWSMRYEARHRYSISVIDFYKDDYILGTNNKKYPVPAVTKTNRFYHRSNRQIIKFSRKNIFLRDDFTCQYCGNRFNHNQLTYDHVIPKSLWDYNSGSPTKWNNIVTACSICNRRKGNRTPKQANMTLKTLPIEPNKGTKYLAIAQHLAKIKNNIPEEWKLYIPESYYNL
jgi:5-methylcytosine-specific restriction endonuclease McrA